METKNNIDFKYFSLVVILIVLNLISCGAEMGSVVITRPDEYRQTYEAKETIVLKAVAGVFRDKKMGSNVTINKEKQTVETDYVVQGDWRTKSMARVKKLNWKESEVILSVIAEKKTKTGWEMRRFLEKDQYVQLFNIIELRIYEEMARIE
ncbi:MAG: hypothetical protein A2031_08545 [Deltaproteobacteria bacterium RBG_19FT_COMBO_43_11]|nr:MAG: hypothetical protein A2031_08545 [Deltaproteobacteria bacterium RBG_19FT_COMBO_43_11]